MRTRILKNFADLPKEFQEDFDSLWQLPEEQRFALIPRVFELSKAATSKESEELIGEIASEIGEDTPTLLRVVKLLNYISGLWNPLWDKPEAFLKDIAELKLIPPEKAEEAKKFLLAFLSKTI